MSANRAAPEGGFPIASPNSSVELIPVISLGIEGRDIPRAPDRLPGDDPQSWHAERQRWLRDRRAALRLDPDRLPDGLIALDECATDRLLDAVIDYCKSCAEQYDGWSPFLDGGFALVVDRHTYARPTCCVDLLEGVVDWLRLSREWGPNWAPIESGHPGVLARMVDRNVQVSVQADEFPDEIPVGVQVGIDQLRRAAEAGMNEIHRFAERLESRMRSKGFDDAARLARIVAGLDPRATQHDDADNPRA